MPRSLRNVKQAWVLFPSGRRTPRLRALPSVYNIPFQHEKPSNSNSNSETKQERSKFARSVLEGSTVALISLLGLGFGGYAYSWFYKKKALDKIENAFSRGYSSNKLVSLGKVAFGTHPDIIKEVLDREYWVP